MNNGMRIIISICSTIFLFAGIISCHAGNIANHQTPENMKAVVLPKPDLVGQTTLERTLSVRRSVRSFTNREITLSEASQLLWAAQGITEANRGLRTAPSAGATFPIEVYFIAANVSGVERGVYQYLNTIHELQPKIIGDVRKALLESALMQQWINEAAAIIVICADYEKTTTRYGDRGIRYVHMECGHVGQNIALQAVALDLGTTMVGAFYDDQLKAVLNLPYHIEPLYIIPVGHPK